MKRVNKQGEPPSLIQYRNAAPDSTWQAMKQDAILGGRTAYDTCRAQLIRDQGGICAYCEIDIRENNPMRCRVEHFHPKSDITCVHNWALDWVNLFGVCAGGSNRYAPAPYTHEPLENNLSCDAYKDQKIQSNELAAQCEGWILNPAEIFASPCLFFLEKSSGKVLPDQTACAISPAMPNNRHPDMQALVQHTIDMLNLNCDRLCLARLVVIRDIERNKKKQRDQGFAAVQGLNNLANQYLRRRWPSLFTTIRLSLGSAAESYLTGIQFQG